MRAATAETTKDPVTEAAQAAYEDAKGDVQDAASRLEQAVRSDTDLRDALTEPLITSACYDAVRRVCITERRVVWRPPVEHFAKSKVEGAYRVIQLAAGTLLMFPLPGGKKLGDATRDEIASAANFYESQSRDMGQKARWLRLIAQSVTDDKTVREVLTDKRLRELQEEARNA